jgi:hypothetical protein
MIVRKVGYFLRSENPAPAPIPKGLKNQGALATEIAVPTFLIVMVVVAQWNQFLLSPLGFLQFVAHIHPPAFGPRPSGDSLRAKIEGSAGS